MPDTDAGRHCISDEDRAHARARILRRRLDGCWAESAASESYGTLEGMVEAGEAEKLRVDVGQRHPLTLFRLTTLGRVRAEAIDA